MEYKSTFTIPSARIYMDELSSVEQDMVRLTFLRYNRMKEWYYNQSYNEKYLEIPFTMDGKTETALLKEHYRVLYGGKLSDYYVTSLFSSVNGMRKSQKELLKLAEQERMQRNLDKRVEIMFPVEKPELQKRLMDILSIQLRDTEKAHLLTPEGTYEKVDKRGKGSYNSQLIFGQMAVERVKEQEKLINNRVFIPEKGIEEV